MRRTLGAIALAVAMLCAAPAAQAGFGIHNFDMRFLDENGAPAVQAGSHPFAVETFYETNYTEVEPGRFEVDGGDFKDLVLELPRGFIGSTTATPTCSALEFATIVNAAPSCADSTAVGVVAALVNNPEEALVAAVFNLEPPPGVPLRLGFAIQGVPVVIDASLKQSPDYNARAAALNAPQPLTVFGAALQLWGVPADPAHDFTRGNQCSSTAFGSDVRQVIVDGRLNFDESSKNRCDAEGAPEKPLLTLPRNCEGPLAVNYEADSWSAPGAWFTGSESLPALQGCGNVGFDPGISSRESVDSAETGTGLDFEIDFEDEANPGSEGLITPDGIAASEMKRVAVTLPAGTTVNPSIAEGLGVCTPADLDRETISSAPGEGCPNASKIGTVEVQTPIVDQPIEGSVFIAQQNDPATAAKENPFDADIAFYIVLKNKDLGALVKVPAEVVPDPRTGQLVTISEDVPQIPFFRFRFHFREGQRAPLISPPTCGTHTTKAEFVPWARPGETVTRTASFQIERGVGGGPCPPGGVPPFHPGFEAGALSAGAARYTPFYMRLTRADGEQDLTRFDAVLPPGVTAKLAGVDRCPDAQISLARTKSGRAELRSPSCPANSRIGSVLGGAGVGSSLTYVPGSLYLAGPYRGAPLSVAAVVPAVAGPFDVGTVVVRVALTLNPVTGEAEVDGAASDAIPHILRGIPLKVRDLRVSADRSLFTLNPTSCEESSTRATVFGSYLDPISPADDVPVSLAARFQAVNCAKLGFKPRLSLRLKGGTKRADFPKLHLLYRPRPGDANLKRLSLRFPHSEFIEQGHFRTICTRVQFAAGAGFGSQCPKGSVYGHARVFTPLLDQPVEGPVFLRSSNHNLPDVVLALHGPPGLAIKVEVPTRIDSIHGGLRATAQATPDLPVSRAVVDMQGGQKGLFVNSTNLCAAAHHAHVVLDGQNGRRAVLRPVLQAQCKKHRTGHRAHKGRG